MNYRGTSVQHRLNFGGVDIESAVNNQILRASDDGKISVLEPGEVASVKPSFGIDHRSGLFWRPVVALHNIGAAHPQFTHLPVRHRLAVASHEFNLNTRKSLADGRIGPG